jgi:glycosyltransferase involved in cell wall biosynthesis
MHSMSERQPAAVKRGRFSVVVPSFQQGEFLERTVRSILDQHDADVEIIVQDGGSTDQSVEILKRYADRVRWESKTDGGQTAAINEGLRKATGEFLCYLNSDDVLSPGALRRVRDCFAAHPTTQVVYGLADFIDEQDQVIAPFPTRDWDYSQLLQTNYICQTACFWRQAVVERFGLFDEGLHFTMDYEYWLRVGGSVPFHFLQEKLAAARCHMGAKTFDQAAASHRETISVLRRYHSGRIPPRWITAYARRCGEDRLREGGPGPWRWMKFATSYWIHLLLLAPKVTPGGAGMLLRKLGPPYSSACGKMRDPMAYFKMCMLSEQGDAARG